MPFSHVLRVNASDRYRDYLAAGIIALYCLTYALVRILISPTMELSEAEQFLDASTFSLGYDQQSPLYSWLARLASLVFGMNVATLTAVKYFLLFLFYFFFFLIARNFWDGKKALLITGSLLLFPTYSYETHRDLTHTILVSVMAVIMSYLYIRMVREAKTVDYMLSGIIVGLGILSKYNFVFFLIALLLSSLSSREGRRVLFDRRIVLSLLCLTAVLLPHFLWLAKENFLSVHYALDRSKAGAMASTSRLRIASIVAFSYLDLLVFLCVAGVFFRRYFYRDESRDNRLLRLFGLLAIYGLVIPLLGIFFFQAGNFTSRWLAPVLFTLPLALFSLIRMDTWRREFTLFSSLCTVIALAILIGRAFVGFFPDAAGKVEHVHIPYAALSQELTDKLRESGIDDFHDLAVITDADRRERCLAANILMWMPEARFVPLGQVLIDSSLRERITERGGIFLFYDLRLGRLFSRRMLAIFPSALPPMTLHAPYLRSSRFPPYELGVIIIPKRERADVKRASPPSTY